jgi:hypothetical protein
MNIALTMLSLKLTGLKSYEKHLLTTLCIRADENTFECWPSIKCLTIDTGLDRKTVQSALISLIEKRCIIKTGKMTGKTKSVPVLRITFASDPVYGAALKLSDPVCPISDPVQGTAKRSRIRDMEGYSLKDTKKGYFAYAKTPNSTPQNPESLESEYNNEVKQLRFLGCEKQIISYDEWLIKKGYD